jgi:hypothetical protein
VVFKKEPAMQNVLRPYATAGIALVGASIIAVTPLAVPPPKVEVRPVQLIDAWSDLFTDTTANLDSIFSNADSSDISQVFSALLTNPLGVIDALTNVDPTVTTTAGLPLTVGVELPPGLELGIAQLGAEGATLDAINSVVGQLASDPSNALNILYEGTATILNAGLNGADNVSLLGGIIDIPAFNGLLAPETSLTVNLNLTDLVNALGLGNEGLGSLDLSSLLSQLGLGDLSLGNLIDDLGLGSKGLGDLLGNPSLGTLLGDLGLGGLALPTLDLTTVLSSLGLDPTTDLNSLSLDSVLSAFGLNPDISLLNDSLSTVLSDTGLLSGVLSDLNSTIGGILDAVPGVGALLGSLLDSVLTPGDLTNALSSITVGDLLGVTGGDSLTDLLAALGIGNVTPSGLTVGGLLESLGFPSSTGDLTLSGLLGGLGGAGNTILDTNLGTLLDGVNLDSLLSDLGISDALLTTLPGTLDLGDLSSLTLTGLLGDLGLGDLANITVDPFGGLITELVDTVPAQILAAL